MKRGYKMADYKRFVSYIYSYNNGEKKNNAGFAKVDLRNGKCKVIIRFKLQYTPGIYPFKVYFFIREDNKLIGIPIGTGKIIGSSFDFKDVINSDNISGSGYNLDKISGIYICDEINKNSVYASEWDNIPVNTDMFTEYIKKAESVKAEPIREEVVKSEPVKEEVKSVNNNQGMKLNNEILGILNSYIKEMNNKEEDKESDILNSENAGESVEDIKGKIDLEVATNNTEPLKAAGEMKEEIPQEEYVKNEEYICENKSIKYGCSRKNDLWDCLYSKYTKIIGIKNNSNFECIKIKPQDLACLPNKYWVLGNNSFLLHGYYNYRYLLFAKVENCNRELVGYKLGVPGIYHRNEKLMASMFGFNEFLEADQNNISDQVFGYWCMDIDINI